MFDNLGELREVDFMWAAGVSSARLIWWFVSQQ